MYACVKNKLANLPPRLLRIERHRLLQRGFNGDPNSQRPDATATGMPAQMLRTSMYVCMFSANLRGQADANVTGAQLPRLLEIQTQVKGQCGYPKIHENV